MLVLPFRLFGIRVPERSATANLQYPTEASPRYNASSDHTMAKLDLAPLFTPFAINGLTLPNRFVMPGMQR
jgi:hypothetical protein